MNTLSLHHFPRRRGRRIGFLGIAIALSAIIWLTGLWLVAS
jgi:hypothetical protein